LVEPIPVEVPLLSLELSDKDSLHSESSLFPKPPVADGETQWSQEMNEFSDNKNQRGKGYTFQRNKVISFPR
jgi:hypothetical protein